jgi:hypothetical protein
MAEKNDSTGVEVQQTRRVEDRRGVSVKIQLEAPLYGGRELTIYLSSYRRDGGEWSPPIVSIGDSGQSGFVIQDWNAIRDAVDRACVAFRALEAA